MRSMTFFLCVVVLPLISSFLFTHRKMLRCFLRSKAPTGRLHCQAARNIINTTSATAFRDSMRRGQQTKGIDPAPTVNVRRLQGGNDQGALSDSLVLVRTTEKKTKHKPSASATVPISGLSRFQDWISKLKKPNRRAREGLVAERHRRYLVIDLETTTQKLHKRVASPFCPTNRVVLPGYLDYRGTLTIPDRKLVSRREMRLPPLDDYDVLVGHNIKFDLLYLWRDPELKIFLLRGGRVWDTEFAEYLLSGHRVKQGEPGVGQMDVALRYGGQRKFVHCPMCISFQPPPPEGGTICHRCFMSPVDLTKKQGVLPPLPFKEDWMYCADLEKDLRNTELIYKRQMTRALDGHQAMIIEARSDVILCTTEMEFNGIFVNGALGASEIKKHEQALSSSLSMLKHQVPDGVPAEARSHFDWTNKNHLSAAYFGGAIVLGGRFACTLPGMVFKTFPDSDERDELFLDENSTTNVSVGVLEEFFKKGCKVSGAMLTVTHSRKVLSSSLTTEGGLLTLRHEVDSCVHSDFSCSSSATGRMTSVNPNMHGVWHHQDIRSLLQSRFQDEGVILEADYSQLEVIVLCALSKDPQMTEDLRANIDFHCKRVTMMLPGVTYEEVVKKAKHEKNPEFVALRQRAKIFSFMRQYGAGVQTISSESGLSEKTVENIIREEDAVYLGANRFFDVVAKSVNSFRPPQLSRGEPTDKLGELRLPTGTRFTFEKSNPKGKSQESFSYTEMKNYPVQGFAGEIVQVMLGRLYRHFVSNNNYGGKAYLTNTVHDSVWMDCHRDVYMQVATDVQRIMSDVRPTFNAMFPELDIEVDFGVEVVAGPTMAQMKPVQILPVTPKVVAINSAIKPVQKIGPKKKTQKQRWRA